MAKPLTDKTLKALQAPGTSRREIPDGGLPGLYAVVQPSGAVSFAYRYRSPTDGRPVKLTLGKYPALVLSDARERAREKMMVVADGRDPAAEKAARKVAGTEPDNRVSALLDDFISRHVDNKRASTATEQKRIIEKEIRPAWGTRKVETLSKRDVLDLIDTIVDRGAVVLANRVLAVVRKFGNWLVQRDVLQVSFANGVAPPSQEASRDTVLNEQQLRLLWAATSEATVLNAAVRLMLVTAQRRGEVAGMTRSELAEPEVWSLAQVRTKNGKGHLVPLSPLAMQAIASAPRIGESGFVFTTTGTAAINGWSKGKEALDAAMLAKAREWAQEAGEDPDAVTLPEWRLHDLRRTAATGMARLGTQSHVIEAVLNHRNTSKVAGIYNRYEYLPEKRKALNAWAKYLARLTGSEGSNVVALRSVK